MATKTKTLSKMTKAEARVAIAKDALAQLRSRKYDAVGGIYVEFDKNLDLPDWGDSSTESNRKANQQVCNLIPKMGTCTVCARGALFLSTIRKFNHFTLGDWDRSGGYSDGCNRDTIETVEDRYFTDKQLSLIESTFEGEMFRKNDTELSDREYNNCINFYSKYSSDHDRLVAILKNIIKNEGAFVP